ncbi:MAG: transketolase, N-terminal subunit [Nitrospirales bacterium]|nr:MAG: transketolase, N-terminal subunit [Nitrospirales bacterium]
MKNIATILRSEVVRMSHQARTPHLGSALSCVDILEVLYRGVLRIDPSNYQDPDRDRFILSKGHAASALYATLAHRGFFPLDVLNTYAQSGSCLPEHPSPYCVPGVEIGSGSLGHGLSVASGISLAARMQNRMYRVFVLLSDGECNEGSTWEGALFASAHNLESLVVIIDYNKWQATGRSDEVMKLKPLAQKWKAFGWSVYEVNGHDSLELADVFRDIPDNTGKPVVIVAHTVKGKGISFMEDDNNWHYRVPNDEELSSAVAELMRI